jgi:hypothetical protein
MSPAELEDMVIIQLLVEPEALPILRRSEIQTGNTSVQRY